MRLLPTSLIVLLASLALAGAIAAAPAGGGQGETVSIEGGLGEVQIRGRGVVIGRVEQGYVRIVDQSANDQWSPRLYGVPRGKQVAGTGKDINFIVPGGKYKIVVRGSGISISARGEGVVQLLGQPDETGAAGMVRIGDTVARAIPTDASLRIPFGSGSGTDAGTSARGSSGP